MFYLEHILFKYMSFFINKMFIIYIQILRAHFCVFLALLTVKFS